MTNLSHVYSAGNRSEQIHRLKTENDRTFLPMIERPDFDKPKAIEYFSVVEGNRPVKDSIQSSIEQKFSYRDGASKVRAKDSLFEST